jgi:hypothetical protein
MPIIIEGIHQGSPEWLELRRGIPTASRFKDIVTTKGMPSKSREKYLYDLAGERLSGEVKEPRKYGSMQKGNDREQEARAYYEFTTDSDVRQVTFVFLDDARRVGCSPDGLVGASGGFETKNAEPHVQVERLEKGWSKAAHFQQVQGCLWICAREWWDIQSYSRNLRNIVIRFHRDEKFIATLAVEIKAFNQELDELVKRLS